LVPACLYLAVLSFYPLVELLRMSVSSVTAADILTAWPIDGTHEFVTLASLQGFRQVLLNTMIYVLIVVAVGVAGGFMAAIAVWRITPLANLALGLMIFIWALPPIINGSLWKFLLNSNGLVDTILSAFHIPPVLWLVTGELPLISVALVNGWAAVPFATMVFRAALLDIPVDVLDAAEVDGARSWRVIRHVVAPLVRPTLLVLLVVNVVYAFRSFDFIYVMTYGGPGTTTTTLPFEGYLDAFGQFKYSLGAAAAVISLVIVVVLATLYIRMIRREAA